MKIKLHEITVREVFNGYRNDDESGQVVAYGGLLNVRPAYQREFVYDDKKRAAAAIRPMIGTDNKTDFRRPVR